LGPGFAGRLVNLEMWFIFVAENSKNMQRLVIPVNESTAITWQRAAPEQRARIISLFCWLIEREGSNKLTPEVFSKLLDEISDQATVNGLTPEILDEILHES